jgi:hypothetical protein
MSDKGSLRSLDSGAGFLVGEHDDEDPPVDCARGVHVETSLAPANTPGQMSLELRSVHHHGPDVYADKQRLHVTLSLLDGHTAASDPAAQAFLQQHPWLPSALKRRLDWLGARAQRAADQRDSPRRRALCSAALAQAEPGTMIPYDAMFPDDWDMLFERDGRTYWVVDHHCPNPACTCAETVLEIQDISRHEARHIGQFSLDMKARPPRPRASSEQVAPLFETLWAHYEADLRRHQREAHQAIKAFAATRPASGKTQPPLRATTLPARNAPCPCRSGKKYKRCCGRAPRAAAQIAAR